MLRIGFSGTPGSGKTTTARAFAGLLRSRTSYSTIELVDEYARHFIAAYGQPSVYDQMLILERQLEEEEKFPPSIDVLVTDSPIFLGFVYSNEVRDLSDPKHTHAINSMYRRFNEINIGYRYDIIFHLPPIKLPVKDSVRPDHHFDESWRNKADQKILSIFELFPPKELITLQKVEVLDRVDECINYLNRRTY